MQKTASPFGLLYQKKESQKTKKAAEPLRGKQRRKPKKWKSKSASRRSTNKAANASGRKDDKKNKSRSNRTQKQLRHSDYCIKKGVTEKQKKQLSRCGGNSEENQKKEIKRRIKAPPQKKAANAFGRKSDEKNKNGSNRMQKQLRHSDLLYQKWKGNINYEKQQKLESNKTSK